jgi:hypothetical protein
MRLTFIKKDPRSNLGHSPTVYTTDDRTLIVQGWTLTDEKARAEMRIPAGEDAVEIPVRMVPFVVQALLTIYEQAAGADTINRLEGKRDLEVPGISPVGGASAVPATVHVAA